MSDSLLALSPLDGRYLEHTALLRPYFSEFAYIALRVRVEITFLLFLNRELRLPRPLTAAESAQLEHLAADFTSADAEWVRALERETRHDVKAIELFLREKFRAAALAEFIPWIHFGLTSEDVNSTAQALALLTSRDQVLLPELDTLLVALSHLAARHAATPMPARTHGQLAVPTTFGKELAVFLARLRPLRTALAGHRFQAHWSGAVGNYNAVAFALPEVDWLELSHRFLAELGLELHPCATQILPYENWLEYFSHLYRINAVLLDLVQDLWRYLSDGYLHLQLVGSEVGSSTMPQKVNPIDFENSEGNLGLANALFEHYQRKLPISRLQRDLSDSTVRRTFGVALGHTLLAWQSIQRGLKQLEVDAAAMRAALEAHWEMLAEGVQTLLRTAGHPEAYEQIKALTRGRALSQAEYLALVEQLPLEESLKSRLRALTPTTYLGLAVTLAQRESQRDAPSA